MAKTYDKLMDLGEAHLHAGEFARANINFGLAARVDGLSLNQAAKAEQMRGIALRLLGNFERSLKTFDMALNHAMNDWGNKLLQSAIMRDKAMAYIDRGDDGDIEKAYTLLTRSNNGLGPEELEAWVTWGFIGRVNLLLGLRRLAAVYMTEADEHLRNGADRNWELDNLIWLMRTSAKHRFGSAVRAWWLATDTGQSRRKAEILVVVAGGNAGYNVAKKARPAMWRPKSRLSA